MCSISFAPCLLLRCHRRHATYNAQNSTQRAWNETSERDSDKNSDIFCKIMCDWRNKLYFKSALNSFQAFNSAHSRKHGTFSTLHIFQHSYIRCEAHVDALINSFGYTIRALTVAYRCRGREREWQISNRNSYRLYEKEKLSNEHRINKHRRCKNRSNIYMVWMYEAGCLHCVFI